LSSLDIFFKDFELVLLLFNLVFNSITFFILVVEGLLIAGDLLDEDRLSLFPVGVQVFKVLDFGGFEGFQQFENLVNGVTFSLEKREDLGSDVL